MINKNLLNKSDTNLFNILFIDENFDDIDDTDDTDEIVNNINISNDKNNLSKSKQINNLRKFKLSKYDIYHINKSLYNLRYPIRFENHDIIRDLLRETNLYTKSSEKITIYDNHRKIIAMVYPMKNATDNFTSNKISSKKDQHNGLNHMHQIYAAKENVMLIICFRLFLIGYYKNGVVLKKFNG
nr:ankyrin repeat domain containing protein [Mimivirus sp.]